jgi:hypothetical protein
MRHAWSIEDARCRKQPRRMAYALLIRIQADVADSIRTAAVHITTRLPRDTPARFLRAEARSSMTVSDSYDVLLVVASKTIQPL